MTGWRIFEPKQLNWSLRNTQKFTKQQKPVISSIKNNESYISLLHLSCFKISNALISHFVKQKAQFGWDTIIFVSHVYVLM